MKVTSLAWAQIVTTALFLLIAGTMENCFAEAPTLDLSEASLEQLGNIKVYSASKHLQSTEDAPSSVTVITGDDIQRHGYRTLADVLRSVRGFFVAHDRNYSSLGVRGSTVRWPTCMGLFLRNSSWRKSQMWQSCFLTPAGCVK